MFLHYTWSTYHLKVNCDRWKVCTINLKATYKTIQIEVKANKPENGIIKTLNYSKRKQQNGKKKPPMRPSPQYWEAERNETENKIKGQGKKLHIKFRILNHLFHIISKKENIYFQLIE